jgi:hypothetical protein
MNEPLRLRFSVFPSTRPLGVRITTDHLTLALRWRRFSVLITDCEGLLGEAFFLVHPQEVLNWIQITGISGEEARKKSPHRPACPMRAGKEMGQATGALGYLAQGHRQDGESCQMVTYHTKGCPYQSGKPAFSGSRKPSGSPVLPQFTPIYGSTISRAKVCIKVETVEKP